MKINQPPPHGNAGNILVDTTNITPQNRTSLKPNKGKGSSSEKKKRITKGKGHDGTFKDVVTPHKKEKSVSSIACQTEAHFFDTIIEEEEDEDSDYWEIIAEERRKTLSLLIDDNKSLSEQVIELEEIINEAKEMAALIQPLVEEEPILEDKKRTKNVQILSDKENCSHSNCDRKSDGKTSMASHLSEVRTAGHNSNNKRFSKKLALKGENSENENFGFFRSDQIYADDSPYVPLRLKTTKDVCVQTISATNSQLDVKSRITAEMLTSDQASPVYFEILANKRKQAIEETQSENNRLKSYIKLLEEMVCEAKRIAEILQSVVSQDEF